MNYYKHETALIAQDVPVGDGTRVWAFVNIQSGAVIGRECNICDGCFIEKGVAVQDRVTIKNGVSVYEGVTLENDVFVGPHAVFVNDKYPRSRSVEWKLEPTFVRQGASLGANCTVMCGVEIGAFALIGAGSVVLEDVPAHALVVGNPARQIGWVDRQGRRLDAALCSPDGETFLKTGKGLQAAGGTDA
jgi:acetyltransferase-like isoleucine patch superfamily enzyme